MAVEATQEIDKKGAKNPRKLRRLTLTWAFIRRYPTHLTGAAIALIFAVIMTLSIPNAIKNIIDSGFGASDPAVRDHYFLMLALVAGGLALATACRFYFVTWIGERVAKHQKVDIQIETVDLTKAQSCAMEAWQVVY